MLTSNELKNGTVFMMDGDPWIVVRFDHNKTGRGGAVNKIKARNLKTGAVVERGFTTGEKFNEANLMKASSQYLYSDEEKSYFMNITTFDQYELKKNVVEDKLKYITEGGKVVVVFLDDKPINIEISPSVVLEVTYTENAVRGNTVSGNALKRAVLETGLEVQVPLFINIGEKIKINTDTNTYTERAKYNE